MGTILTIGNLCKKKVLILDWCYKCKSNSKSVDHLLHIVLLILSCGLWCSPCLVSIGQCQRLVELLACWQGNFGHHCNVVIWMAIPHCLMWCIWQERNNRCFEDFEMSIADLKQFFFKTLSDWMSIIGSHSIFSVYDLMNACNLCT